jgi:hypothetical protein
MRLFDRFRSKPKSEQEKTLPVKPALPAGKGIPLTIPAELVDGKLIIYYERSSFPVPFGTRVDWKDGDVPVS